MGTDLKKTSSLLMTISTRQAGHSHAPSGHEATPSASRLDPGW